MPLLGTDIYLLIYATVQSAICGSRSRAAVNFFLKIWKKSQTMWLFHFQLCGFTKPVFTVASDSCY